LPSHDREVGKTRDDDDAQYPRSYSVDEVQLSFTVASPWGGDPMSRTAHGYLTTPEGTAPAGGWPALIVLNGHHGSAAALLDQSDPIYWYGDAWARRGFVVLALDMSHRPVEDRGGLYGDYENGDDPNRSNNAHPSMKTSGLDSDWVENGERAWDVERGIDWLASLGTINMERIGVTGLSMGGELATLAGALDPRLRIVIASGAPPSLAMMPWHGNHGCYQWTLGNARDYYESADVAALVAPRALIVEIGHDDTTFSDNTPSFISAKEEMRTTMSAFADAPSQLMVYLHPGGHEYRFGDVYVGSGATGLGVLSPTVMSPRQAGDTNWSADDATTPVAPSVADALEQFLPQRN
jgi:dienelactone hydrolase